MQLLNLDGKYQMFKCLFQLFYMFENFHNKMVRERESVVSDFINLERKSIGLQLRTFPST